MLRKWLRKRKVERKRREVVIDPVKFAELILGVELTYLQRMALAALERRSDMADSIGYSLGVDLGMPRGSRSVYTRWSMPPNPHFSEVRSMSAQDGDGMNTKDTNLIILDEAKGSAVRPAHYNMGKIEVVEVLEDWKLGHHEATAVEYIARARYKDNETENLCKAAWWLLRKIRLLRQEDDSPQAVQAVDTLREAFGEFLPKQLAYELGNPNPIGEDMPTTRRLETQLFPASDMERLNKKLVGTEPRMPTISDLAKKAGEEQEYSDTVKIPPMTPKQQEEQLRDMTPGEKIVHKAKQAAENAAKAVKATKAPVDDDDISMTMVDEGGSQPPVVGKHSFEVIEEEPKPTKRKGKGRKKKT